MCVCVFESLCAHADLLHYSSCMHTAESIKQWIFYEELLNGFLLKKQVTACFCFL